MAQAQIEVLHEAEMDKQVGWNLCLQYCRFCYSDGREEYGYRFTWRKPEGTLLTRGQARIPSFADIHRLMAQAIDEGWGNFQDGDFSAND